MVTIQHGTEELHVQPARRIEPRVTSAGKHHWLGQLLSSGVGAVDQWKMTLTTTDRLGWVARVEPTAVLPAIVLVLSLYLADVGVDFPVDVLLVAGATELGGPSRTIPPSV